VQPPKDDIDNLIYDLMGFNSKPLKRLREVGNGTVAIEDSDEFLRWKGMDCPADGYTMIGYKRLRNIYDLLKHALDNNLPGSFIETGVWKGGASILAAHVLKGTGRKVYVCDSFRGLPKPDTKYPVDQNCHLFEQAHLRISKQDVMNNFQKFGLLNDNVVFVEGFFEDTLPTIKDVFSLIRLDGDMYGSTWCALENLYPQLTSGAGCIIDDWILTPAREAVYDYRTQIKEEAPIVDIDGIGVYWLKNAP